MAGSSTFPAVSNPVPVTVISPQFCAGYPIDLNIVRKMMTLSEGNFTVTDVNGKIVFTVKGKLWSIHDRRVLLDAAGNPILTYRQKLMSAHRRWLAYKGESTDEKDMLFTVKKSKLFQMRTKLDVCLAGNTSEEVCDFRIEGSWFERSCTIYAGTSNNIIAQMHRKHTASSILIGKDNFWVTVYPNVDYAFIVALAIILEEINTDRQDS